MIAIAGAPSPARLSGASRGRLHHRQDNHTSLGLGKALAAVLLSALAAAGCSPGAISGMAGGELAEIVVARGSSGGGPAAGPDGITPNAASLVVGGTVQLRAIDAAGQPVDAKWSTSNESVASVDATGLVRGAAPGEIVISARLRNRSAEARVEVLAPVIEPAPAPSIRQPGDPSTWIYPGESIQAAVDAHPAGTHFIIRPGVHRMQRVTPKDGNAFVGEPGAVMSGARLLTGFAKEGDLWVVGGQTQQGKVHGRCADGFPGCAYSEDLFIDDAPLQQVMTIGDLRPGTWYFDYAGDRIYIADDPEGRTVETSVTAHAFIGAARNVVIRGLTIEKYASPAQHGAIHGADGTNGPLSEGWLVENSIIRLNHGVGLRIGHRMRVIGNFIHHNGQLGMGGVGDGVLVEDNEIAYNHTGGFSIDWEAGGTKFVKTDGLVVRGNHVHHNNGPGLWTDIDNVRTLYENNTVEDNLRAGIFHEISYSAVIRNNRVRRNGFGHSKWLWGAGILIAASSDVEVYGNTVEENADGITAVQQNRGSGAMGEYLVRNVSVHDNTIRMTGGVTGVAQDIGDNAIFESRNVQFEKNTYHLGSASRYFAWMNGDRTEMEWRSFGQDANGVFVR